MLLALAAAWIAIGAIGVAVMRHRGHDTFAWGVLFVFFGPLAVPLAISSDRGRPPDPDLPSHDGDFDVLIDLNGSAGQAEAIEAALKLLGDHITSVTIATTLDLEAPTTVRGRDTQREAEERLEDFARDLSATTDAPIDTVVLYGQSTGALQRFAAEHGFELIVAGNRITTRSPASVPVLIAPTSKQERRSNECSRPRRHRSRRLPPTPAGL